MAVDTSEAIFCEVAPSFIKQAEDFAKYHYDGFTHPTGEAYYRYTSEVVGILRHLHADPTTIVAAILYHLPSVTKITLDSIKKQFGEEVGKLVAEVLNLDKLEWDIRPIVLEEKKNQELAPVPLEQDMLEERRAALQRMFLLAIGEIKNEDLIQSSGPSRLFQKREKQVENLIRMFVAATNDIRAIIIKLAERLHFTQCLLRLVQAHPTSLHTENSRLFAKITLAVYAPLADRLGIWQLKSKIEDVSFQFLYPDKFEEINAQFIVKEEQREKYIAKTVIPALKKVLGKNRIQAEISWRFKHIYSIYQKMEQNQLTQDEVNDILGVRIIVNSDSDCYKVQSILHHTWEPITAFYHGKVGRDWIANPKENLYQSLHTTIQMDDKAVEVQIRTQYMHKIAEYGVNAAHWLYKEGKNRKKAKMSKMSKGRDGNRKKQINDLRNNIVEVEEVPQRNLVKDSLFIITPMGDVISLHAPTGATPLDFAYRIHTSLGHMYAGAKVGGRPVGADYALKNGDCVELLKARKRTGPNPKWLSKEADENGKMRYVFACTRQARAKIRKGLKTPV